MPSFLPHLLPGQGFTKFACSAGGGSQGAERTVRVVVVVVVTTTPRGSYPQARFVNNVFMHFILNKLKCLWGRT